MAGRGDDVDLLAVGRCGVDLYPLTAGVALEDVGTFTRSLGGSAANVAVAAARLGHSAGLVSAVGDDPFGRFVRRELARLGVGTDDVATLPGRRTPLTFCELHAPDDFPLWFHRGPDAPDLQLDPAGVPLDAARRARVLWLTATGLSAEPSRTAHHALLDARRDAPPGNAVTVLDLDHRPELWADPAQAGPRVREVLERVTVAVGNVAECAVAVGEDDPDRAADALLAAGVRLAVVKRGPQGVLARTAHERVELPATRVDVVNGLGAGDAFGGALVHGLLSGWRLEPTIAFASAAGAVVAARLACAPDMPTVAEVEHLLRTGDVPARPADAR